MNRYKCPACKTEVVVNSAKPSLKMPCQKCGSEQDFAPSSRRVNAEIGKTQPPTPIVVEEPKPNVDMNRIDVHKPLAKPETSKQS